MYSQTFDSSGTCFQLRMLRCKSFFSAEDHESNLAQDPFAFGDNIWQLRYRMFAATLTSPQNPHP